jgi:hypothetical protein
MAPQGPPGRHQLPARGPVGTQTRAAHCTCTGTPRSSRPQALPRPHSKTCVPQCVGVGSGRGRGKCIQLPGRHASAEGPGCMRSTFHAIPVGTAAVASDLQNVNLKPRCPTLQPHGPSHPHTQAGASAPCYPATQRPLRSLPQFGHISTLCREAGSKCSCGPGPGCRNSTQAWKRRRPTSCGDRIARHTHVHMPARALVGVVVF